MIEKREQLITLWLRMWLEGTDLGIDQILAPDCIYIESWGPKYVGRDAVKHWFREWNTRGRVLVWDAKQFFHREDQTVVEWHFEDRMDDGRAEKFDGVSIFIWNRDGQICRVKEFGCKLPHYNPYAHGHIPTLNNTDMWT